MTRRRFPIKRPTSANPLDATSGGARQAPTTLTTKGMVSLEFWERKLNRRFRCEPTNGGSGRRQKAALVQLLGGGGRNRTGVHGFAVRCMATLPPRHDLKSRKGSAVASLSIKLGAGDESRTRDLNLGKVALYQLSYSRTRPRSIAKLFIADRSSEARRASGRSTSSRRSVLRPHRSRASRSDAGR